MSTSSPVPPKITPFSFGEDEFDEGQSAALQCTVSSGDLPLTIEWKLFGEKLENYPGVSVTSMGKKMSILAIDSVSWRHGGNYTCVARNAAGESEFTAPLLVNGTPS